MYSRNHQADILKEEGLLPTEKKEHRMTLWYSYKDKNRGTEGREVVDVSAPFNAMDETHRVRRFGTARGFGTMNSLNELIGVQEQVPYTDSHHSFEWGTLGFAAILGFWINTFMGKTGYGNVVMNNPHLLPSTTVWFWMALIRTSIGAAIASYGYFYSYEFLYTYVPGFKIRDPSLNAWRRPWDEGQGTYMARLVASLMPCLGYAFCAGRLKRVGTLYTFVAGFGLYYEYAREYVLSGTRNFYNVLAEKQLTREANWGSLAGELQKRNDPDSGRNATVSQFRYIRLTAGMLQDAVWENCTHETLPLHPRSLRIDNPYYNWQRAPQAYNAEPINCKNQLWQLPSVLNARVMSGALDAR